MWVQQGGAATPLWVLVGLHMVLMVALACLFTPCFTTGLNPLPPDLYSHGSAILSTLQQVAGAAGTALLVAIMSSQTAALTAGGPARAGGAQRWHQPGLPGRGRASVIGAIVCAIFMRNPKPEPSESADELEVEHGMA